MSQHKYAVGQEVCAPRHLSVGDIPEAGVIDRQRVDDDLNTYDVRFQDGEVIGPIVEEKIAPAGKC